VFVYVQQRRPQVLVHAQQRLALAKLNRYSDYMEPWLVTTLLLITANGTPVITSVLLGDRWAWPLDGNTRFIDQRPLLGASKTLRGLVMAIVATAVVAVLLGMTWIEGAGFGLLAMLGDICSSFIKRRLGFRSSQSAPVLDQLPETLLPAWVMQPALGTSTTGMLAAVAVFFVIDLLFSQLLDSKTAR
jgi:CDP-diglyceride synthetase